MTARVWRLLTRLDRKWTVPGSAIGMPPSLQIGDSWLHAPFGYFLPRGCREARFRCPIVRYGWRDLGKSLMIRITEGIAIDEAEIEESFVRASGPGGQNVNKLATAVQLRFDARRSPALSAAERSRLAAARRPPADARRRHRHHRPAAPHPGAQPPRRARPADRADPPRGAAAAAAQADAPDACVPAPPPGSQGPAVGAQDRAHRPAGGGLIAPGRSRLSPHPPWAIAPLAARWSRRCSRANDGARWRPLAGEAAVRRCEPSPSATGLARRA